MARQTQRQHEEKEFEERVLYLRRVSKKTTGGNYISFSALVAIGDGKGRVGIGLGRGLEVPPAIQKAISQAKRRMITLPIFNDTLPHEIKLKYKSSVILLKPAPPGTGLKVGGVVRAVLDIAGVNNASGKIMGTRNQITNAYAVMRAIAKLKPRIVAEDKKKSVVSEVTAEAQIPEQEVAVVRKDAKDTPHKESPKPAVKKEKKPAQSKTKKAVKSD